MKKIKKILISSLSATVSMPALAIASNAINNVSKESFSLSSESAKTIKPSFDVKEQVNNNFYDNNKEVVEIYKLLSTISDNNYSNACMDFTKDNIDFIETNVIFYELHLNDLKNILEKHINVCEKSIAMWDDMILENNNEIEKYEQCLSTYEDENAIDLDAKVKFESSGFAYTKELNKLNMTNKKIKTLNHIAQLKKENISLMNQKKEDGVVLNGVKSTLDKTNEKLNVLKTIKEKINYLKKQNFKNT